MIPVARRQILAKYRNECEKPGFGRIHLTVTCCRVVKDWHRYPQSQGEHPLPLRQGTPDTLGKFFVRLNKMSLFRLTLKCFLCRLSDIQISFRQQSGPTATTNIERQPSFDKTQKTDSTVSNRQSTIWYLNVM